MSDAVTLYGLKNCDTCTKARKALENKGFTVSFIDVRAEPLSKDVLQRFLDRFSEQLVNTRSTTWRGLDDQERARSPLELLQAHPSLMKRPVIMKDDGLFLGWKADTQMELGV